MRNCNFNIELQLELTVMLLKLIVSGYTTALKFITKDVYMFMFMAIERIKNRYSIATSI